MRRVTEVGRVSVRVRGAAPETVAAAARQLPGVLAHAFSQGGPQPREGLASAIAGEVISKIQSARKRRE